MTGKIILSNFESMAKFTNDFKNKKTEEFIAYLLLFRKNLENNPEACKQLLIDAGIITEKGNLKKHYRGLCIPMAKD